MTTLPVLMYHSVSRVDAGPLRGLAVPPEVLGEQWAALRGAGYELVGLTEAVTRKRARPADRVIALTFDDGYLDFLTDGLEVLREAGARATLYVAVGHIGADAPPLPAGTGLGPLLSWPQVRYVAGAGIEIGNHSLVHQPLDVVPEPDLSVQVRVSRERLEEETGRPVTSFAYPHGYHSGRVRALVAYHGHRTACEVGHRLHRLDRDPFAISRLLVGPDHAAAELVRLVQRGAPGPVPALKRAAQPAWRATRWVALHAFHRRLT
jgi:peptidoglycan/xylan/chitin deacetylase (PgdA/CDA1 family)